MSKKKIGTCYLCGKKKELTDDHVPPKCLSPKSPNNNFFHVDACKECNNKLSREESIVRDFLSVISSGKGNRSADEAFKKAKSNFERGKILRKGLPSKDLVRVIKGLDRKDFYTESGIFLGNKPVLSFSEENKNDLNKVLVKFAKGLHYFNYKLIIPKEYKNRVIYLNNSEGIDLYKKNIESNLRYKGNAGDFFHFKGGAASDDNKTGIWFMTFYGGHFSALVFFSSSI